jgi:hypothetical protein
MRDFFSPDFTRNASESSLRDGGMQWDNILNLAENPIWLSSGGFRPSYLCGKLSPSGELGS